MYKMFVKKSVLKDIRKIPTAFLSKIESVISNLAETPLPSGVKKVQGYSDYYRIRVGMYRVVYRVQEEIEIVTIFKVRSSRCEVRSSRYRTSHPAPRTRQLSH